MGRKQRKKRFLMMKEKKKTRCSNNKMKVKCVKPKMDLERKSGSQDNTITSVACSRMTMKNQRMQKVWMMTKIATRKVCNKKKMKMMNKAIITFERAMSDIYLTYSSLLVTLNIMSN